MPFCHAPWSNIDISPQGNIMPCCKYQPQAATPNINSHSIVEYFSSAELATVKQQFLEDQWPSGCDRCRIEEENNIASMIDMNTNKDLIKSIPMIEYWFIRKKINDYNFNFIRNRNTWN